ncbi:ribosomal protein S5-alanine N-acetyltransferase [Burkholderia alba]|uniref:ribosomal protein S5-alanine N-acetyltransferase n=1 Tax=Burkholderia alba TaxID=2683677 RepID=UPI002B056F01|nr:ribosomal protein S5-alanine N-acetyltransferase [Burkholderia alba]
MQLARERDGPALLRYQIANRAHLSPWEPLRQEDFYTPEAVESRLRVMTRQHDAQSALHLLLLDDDQQSVIGECNFTNIVRGPFQACHLGFSIDSRLEGRGLMAASLRVAIDHVFTELALHRIMANYRPENERSGALLARLGFEREGYARRYLKIGGIWTDHVLTALINPSDLI